MPRFENVMKPFSHQAEAFNLSKDSSEFGLFMEQGTGKTKVVLDTAQHLFLKQEIDGLLVIAPKGGYMNWVNEEIPAHLPSWFPVRVAWWNANATQKESKKAMELMQAEHDCLDIMVMNVEGLATERAFNFAEQFIQSHYCMMVIDESTYIKSPKAQRTKASWKLGVQCDYRRILSGTPISQGPLDLFAQCEFLKKGLLGFSSYLDFKSHYAQIEVITFGNRRFEKIKKYLNQDELRDSIKKFTYRKLKTECLDLPEKLFQTHYVEHTPEQAAYYEKMRTESLIQFSDRDMVSSTSVLTTIVKLHQINCGHVKLDEGVTIDIPNNRIPELLSILENITDKVIIWCHFRRDVELVTKALNEEYGPGTAVDYYGATDDDDRVTNLSKFRTSARFFVSTAATGGRALTLVEAPYAIYYSYDYNLERWLQSQDRNHRIGQTKNVTYITMVTKKTVDEKISKALREKKNLADEILDNWRLLLT